jgi:hypothetical protein
VATVLPFVSLIDKYQEGKNMTSKPERKAMAAVASCEGLCEKWLDLLTDFVNKDAPPPSPIVEGCVNSSTQASGRSNRL